MPLKHLRGFSAFLCKNYTRRKKIMAERKQAQDLFLRTYKLSSFKAFNPKYKEECLSGAEMMLLLEIVRERLIYIRIDEKAYNGNTIKIDKEYREKVLEYLGVGQGCFEHMLTKLTTGGILYKIRNGYYLMNPYCFAKGEEKKVKFARSMGIFRSSTINLEKGFKPFLKDIKSESERKKAAPKVIPVFADEADGVYEEDGELFAAEERVDVTKEKKTEKDEAPKRGEMLKNSTIKKLFL